MNADEKQTTSPVEEKTPAEIREEIEGTRAEMGDTVEALAEKTDVKARAQAKVEDAKAQAKVEDVREKATEAAPESPRDGVRQAQELVRQNPRPAAIAGGLVALFVLWRLLRS